jgi:hypothetical protein
VRNRRPDFPFCHQGMPEESDINSSSLSLQIQRLAARIRREMAANPFNPTITPELLDQ